MALPATAEEIYDLLVADEDISAALGTCTMPGQEEPLPAIGVFSSNERLPEGTVMAGIEIAILRNPGPSPELMLTGETLLNPMFRLYVSQWPPGEGVEELWPVVQRIIALLPGATATPIEATGGRGDDLGLLDQYAVRWTNPVAHVVTPEPVPPEEGD